MNTAEFAEKQYDEAREVVAKATRAMVEAHDAWNYAAEASEPQHPTTVQMIGERWIRFQLRSDEWQQAMAKLRVARRRYERLHG